MLPTLFRAAKAHHTRSPSATHVFKRSHQGLFGGKLKVFGGFAALFKKLQTQRNVDLILILSQATTSLNRTRKRGVHGFPTSTMRRSTQQRWMSGYRSK